MKDFPSKSLPETGPLVDRGVLEVTNRDLLENGYKQNAVINEVRGTVQTLKENVQVLSTTVASHAKVIELLTSLKSMAVWMLCFLGLSGVVQLLHWLAQVIKE